MAEGKDIQKELSDIEGYLTSEIAKAFPQLKIKSFYNYDLDGDDFIGTFTEANNMVYGFVLTKGDTGPILRRVG